MVCNRFGDAASAALAEVVAASLMQQCSRSVDRYRKSRFATKSATISLSAFARRLAAFLDADEEIWVAARIYLTRYSKAAPEGAVSDVTVHKLLLVALVLAEKYHDDLHCTNAFYASIGGVTLQELNELELDFLQSLGWQLHTPAAELTQCHWMLRSGGFGTSRASMCNTDASTHDDSTCDSGTMRSMAGSDAEQSGVLMRPKNPRRSFGQRLASCLRSNRLAQCKPDARLLF